LQLEGGLQFPVATHMTGANGYPYLDWRAVQSWIDTLSSRELQAQAWGACERAWLLHLRAALGAGYRLDETDRVMLLSSLEPRVAWATPAFVTRTLERTARLLDGVAATSEWGRDILIVFDDQDGYYRYISHYYPEEREFALSGGMHLSGECSHFVTVKADLREIEPVIAHEMTHGCLAHLPLPAWLNEGIAVNTERKLTGARATLYPPDEMHRKHLVFWGRDEMQEFWSGKTFLRADDGNMLSYDLARILVEQMAQQWGAFRDFVLAADREDAGLAAARDHLGVDLGAFACAILEPDDDTGYAPDPGAWDSEPEKGGFAATEPASGKADRHATTALGMVRGSTSSRSEAAEAR
jgi:hypothetical protein